MNKIQEIADEMGQIVVDLTHTDRNRRIGYVEFQRKQKILIKQLIEQAHKEASKGSVETLSSATDLAMLFHDTYEKLAQGYSYETRQDTKIFNPESPNGKLMIQTCKVIMKAMKEGK